MMRLLVVAHIKAGVRAGEQLVAPCSPYLLRPLKPFGRPAAIFRRRIQNCYLLNSMRTPISRRLRCVTTPSLSKTKGAHPSRGDGKFTRPEKNKPVRQSEFFETMSEATLMGKTALAELRANQAA